MGARFRPLRGLKEERAGRAGTGHDDPPAVPEILMADSPRPHRAERITVRITAEERQRIETAARCCGLNPSAYLRSCGLGEPPRSRTGKLEREAIHHLARVGNDLKQLARLANTHGHLRSLEEIDATVARIQSLLEELRGR